MYLDKEEKGWEFIVGTYPGFMFGFRMYQEVDCETYAFYIPFVNFILILDK
jgi:hypothetical protein